MKLLAILAAFVIAVAAQGQTIKSLGYNTTNGQVVVATNVAWTNAFTFSTSTVAAQIRTNLGLPWIGLTSTNAATFSTALGITVGLDATNLLPSTAAIHLFDETGQQISLKGDDGEFSTSSSFVTTNAPTDATNAVRWLILTEGTNSYRLPLYQ